MSRTVGLFALALSVLAATVCLGAIVLVSEDEGEGRRAPRRLPEPRAQVEDAVETAVANIECATLTTAEAAVAPARHVPRAEPAARPRVGGDVASLAEVRAALERCTEAGERRTLVRALKLLRHRGSPLALADAPEPDLNGIAHARAAEVLPEQLTLLLDPVRAPAVRAAAAGALGSVASDQAEGYLLDALASGDTVARALAAQRLARRSRPPSPAAVDALLCRIALEHDTEAARACVEALGASGAAAAVSPLLARAARSGPIGEAARRGLVRLAAAGADVPFELACVPPTEHGRRTDDD